MRTRPFQKLSCKGSRRLVVCLCSSSLRLHRTSDCKLSAFLVGVVVLKPLLLVAAVASDVEHART